MIWPEYNLTKLQELKLLAYNLDVVFIVISTAFASAVLITKHCF